MLRGDPYYASLESARDWNYFAINDMINRGVADAELAHKRVERQRLDQATIDRLVCELAHPGGKPPIFCAFASFGKRSSTSKT